MLGSRELAAIAVMAVLCFVATYSIMIPIPATSGYFKIGNVFIIISGLVFGSIVAGGFGPAISDLIGGYYFSVPFTLIIKGCEGFVAGYVGGRLATAKLNRVILAWALSARAGVVGVPISQALKTRIKL